MSDQHINVLLIEDCQEDRELIQRLLARTSASLSVYCVGSLTEGLVALQAQTVDIVLLDLGLPEGTGLETFLEFQQQTPHVPVVVLSGLNDESVAIRAVQAGAQDYLTKERFDAEWLLRSLQHAMERHRLVQRLAANRAQLEALIAAAVDGILIVDTSGSIRFANPAAAAIFGRPAEALVGEPFTGLHASDQPMELDFRRADGANIVLEARGALIEWNGAPALLASLRDITERKRFESALRLSEERYALAAAGANDGLWDWDFPAGTIHFSVRWKAMLGFEDHEIGTSPEEWLRRVHPEDVDRVESEVSLHSAGVIGHFEAEYRIRHRDGSWRWMLARGIGVRDEAGKIVRMAGSQTDITRRKLAETKLLFEAHHDSLTLLPNRTLFLKRLDRLIERGRRQVPSLFAVLFVDFDRFKVVNDSLGHLVGDELLVTLAQRLLTSVRPEDMVARLGGDEFAILLEPIQDVADAIRVAERIHERMQAAAIIEGHSIVTSASIGIAFSSTGYERSEDILRDADIAMYRAKELGKARHVIFDSVMHAQAVATLHLESDLRQALERSEFELYYQPIVSLRTGRVTALEALLRWQHPERGLVLPGEFIRLAEENRLILPIGEWVLDQACRQIAAWQQRFPELELAVNVNLSARQVEEHGLAGRVRQVLDRAGLEARRLLLRMEITETALMDGTDAATLELLELKDLGVQLCIDDFGTGYSSLSYLHRFPIDFLKIDRSFISRLEVGGENSEIVRTIVMLAHSVGVEAIAEGVEKDEQVRHLTAMQCEYAQGYHFAPPLAESEATELLAREVAALRTSASFLAVAPPGDST